MPEADIIGEIHLKKDGRKTSLYKSSYGHAKIPNGEKQYSYSLELTHENWLEVGKKCVAQLNFKFVSQSVFSLQLNTIKILELYEGQTKIGDFEIEEIINKKLI